MLRASLSLRPELQTVTAMVTTTAFNASPSVVLVSFTAELTCSGYCRSKSRRSPS